MRILHIICLSGLLFFNGLIASAQTQEVENSPILALKTNLLFDVATAVNVAIEVPIGKRVSIEAEHIFPNWGGDGYWPSNNYCLQACISSLETRIWLGSRKDKRVLTGHFLGAYGQYGDFDFQPFTDHGWRVYKGWAAGLSYGFAHTVNRSGTGSFLPTMSRHFSCGRDSYRMIRRIRQCHVIPPVRYDCQKLILSMVGMPALIRL